MQTALQWLLDAAPSNLLLLDEAGHIVLANRRLENTLGYPRSELVGQSVDALLSESARGPFAACRGELWRAAEHWNRGASSQLRVVRRDGAELEATVNLSVVSAEGGQLMVASMLSSAQSAASFEQFSLALEAVPTGMILTDEQGHVILVNRQTECLFGYKPGELLGKSLELLVPERLRAHHEKLRHTFFSNAQTRAMGAGQELYGIRKDRVEIPVEIGLNALTINGRKLVLSSVVDITERKRATSHFQLALEAAPTAMLLVNARGKILLVNAQVEKIFGHSREALVGQQLEVLVPQPLREKHQQLRLGFFEHASTRPMGAGRDLYGLHREGHEVPIEIALTTLDEREGRLVLTSIVDITERKLVERALRENEARHCELFNASPVALFEQDLSETRTYLMALLASGVSDLRSYLAERPDVLLAAISKMKTLMVNQRALQLFEANDASELRDLAALFVPQTLTWFCSGLCQLLAGERYFAQETVTRTVKGKTKIVSQRIHVLPGQQETWSRVVVSFFDLTPHKRAEERLRASLHEKDVLLKEVHHRVKNNLQIVSSLLNMKAHDIADAGMRQLFADCQARVQSLAFVQEQLYASGELSHVPFGKYVRTLVDHLKQICRDAGRSINSRIEIGDINLLIDDAIPCGLIVNELVTNALKHAFTADRGGCIEISMQKLDSKQLELSVSDDGRGLPPEFEPRKADSSGLELVYTFAEQLQAEVELIRGRGTRFVFRFTPGVSGRSYHDG